ncbi:hypothetical protein [Variovorax saccharolyticus]|uniref:hypothetical protein n=1 Tax=Variovorax saccharolyticus TaxID=3053516 RepID=UPI00257793EE|nr:hypothetical protein [Variovorax sp. J22R187]MDM0022715.1 hypothetical protein [Variovorax sp. J22R187]
MNPTDRAELARLWTAWLECRASAGAERERLIEKAGDHMCAGCPAPNENEVAALEQLERGHRAAWQAYSSRLLHVYAIASWASRIGLEKPTVLGGSRGGPPSGD